MEVKHLESIGKLAFMFHPIPEPVRSLINIAKVREEEEIRNESRKDLDVMNARYAHLKPTRKDLIQLGKDLSLFEKKRLKKLRKVGSLYHN